MRTSYESLCSDQLAFCREPRSLQNSLQQSFQRTSLMQVEQLTSQFYDGRSLTYRSFRKALKGYTRPPGSPVNGGRLWSTSTRAERFAK